MYFGLWRRGWKRSEGSSVVSSLRFLLPPSPLPSQASPSNSDCGASAAASAPVIGDAGSGDSDDDEEGVDRVPFVGDEDDDDAIPPNEATTVAGARASPRSPSGTSDADGEGVAAVEAEIRRRRELCHMLSAMQDLVLEVVRGVRRVEG